GLGPVPGTLPQTVGEPAGPAAEAA
ncbi:MAG: hypothetical protein RL458_2005, partial [Pseudomonadota bacterium]